MDGNGGLPGNLLGFVEEVTNALLGMAYFLAKSRLPSRDLNGLFDKLPVRHAPCYKPARLWLSTIILVKDLSQGGCYA